jgi:REG-2-like HAD superfamily hydrolase
LRYNPRTMTRYSTVIFDVGGTLLRLNVQAMARIYVDACAALGMPTEFARACAVIESLEHELPIRQQQRLVSLENNNGKDFWIDFYTDGFRRLGVAGDVFSFADEIRARFQRAEFETLFDDVVPALDAIAARKIPMGILSNFSVNLENVLRQVGVHHYFSFFVVSAVAGVEKPNPKIFELAAQSAAKPRAELVYIGDSIFHDVEGARNVGMDAILIDRKNQHPGFSGIRLASLTELVKHLE